MFSTSLLKGLVSAGSVSRLTARAVSGGFLLFVRVGLEERPVKSYRGQARIFKKLDAVANYVQELGLSRFDTELSEWVPNSSPNRRKTMAISSHRKEVEQKVLVICRKQFMSLGEIADQLAMNRNTVRAGYLYPMANDGRLTRSEQQPVKSGMRYKTSPINK